MKIMYSRGLTIPVTVMIMRIYNKTEIPVGLHKSGTNWESFQAYSSYMSVSHTVKFSRASLGLILSSLLKSSEKEFILIQSTTYCIGWRENLPPPAYLEWLESEKEMEALPAAMAWPPGAVAFCEIQSSGGKHEFNWERRKRKGWWGGNLFVLTLYGQGVSQKKDRPVTRCSRPSPTSHQIMSSMSGHYGYW